MRGYALMASDSLVLLKLTFSIDTLSFSLDASLAVVAVVAIVSGIFWWLNHHKLRRFKLVKVDIALGKIGKAELRPNIEDIQVAHKIWTELVTRKAAIPIDPDHDVIVEVYDSWYALFTKVRELVSSIPAELIKEEKSTKELVRIATSTLNNGLRPHLTRWQARFRGWYEANSDRLKELTPQELQKQYPEYLELITDMKQINQQMIIYAEELKRLIDG
ncbi:hypothetical protein [Methylogaea oryzae]|nr:hypothetical protein [Methylogaea oryzae]